MSYYNQCLNFIIDKPTRDELIELLSSSKFTAGTWEQFVCCLPNVTQEVVTDIKQREKKKTEKEEEEEEAHITYSPMSAVAQHCININPDMTWRGVIDALLDHNEVSSVQQVLISIEYSNSGTKGLCKNDVRGIICNFLM